MPIVRATRRPSLAALLLGSALGGALGGGPTLATETPLAVSPGRDTGAALAPACPTFSWGRVTEAESYELVVYRFSDDAGGEARQVLVQRLPGEASSWTPSLERCLEEGGEYAWSIRAERASSGSTIRRRGQNDGWSRPSLFRVASRSAEPDLAAALAVVERHLAAGGEASGGSTEPSGSSYDRSSAGPERGSGSALLTVEGLVSAQGFSGDGSQLTALAPESLTAGTADIDIAGSASTLSAVLGTAKGGTGAADAATARTNLGAASQASLVDLSSQVEALAAEVGATETCEAPFDALERVFPESGGTSQRICATGRLTQPVPTVFFQEMVADQVQALCDMWAEMPKSSPAYDHRGPIEVDTAPIKKALTDVEVLIENVLGDAFGAIDDAFNQFDNLVEGAVNPMFNTIDGEACPGDCWPTNPVNVPNLNLDNSLRNLDFAPFANVIDLAEVIIENPDALSLICLDSGLEELYVQHWIETMPPLFENLAQTFDYGLAESNCAELGGHVCSAPELYQLADGDVPGVIGCQQGDWVQGGDVIGAPNSATRHLFETPWPPIRVDLSPLLSVPPGLPFSISYPIPPSGGYRCCVSSVDF